jgi:hypothetical protein
VALRLCRQFFREEFAMAPRAANLTSTEAIRTLKIALQQFAESARKALVQFELESRRPLDWIEHDRTLYWPRQMHLASDALNEARMALARCELTINEDDRRSCYDERKALEKAKRRLRLTEEKIDAVRRWRVLVRKEVEEFQTQIAKLNWYLDSDFLRGIAALQRMGQALDEYTSRLGPSAAPTSPAATDSPKPSTNQ